jgi:hypothetical protein
MIKAVETIYKGYKFRSRLEARWAVFFDAIGAEWEYEAQGFELDDGTCYLPDFVLHNVGGRMDGGDLWVEVKGVMTEEDKKKIQLFGYHFLGYYFHDGESDEDEWAFDGEPLLVVGEIPPGNNLQERIEYMALKMHEYTGYYDLETVDGDCEFLGYLGTSSNHKPVLNDGNDNYSEEMDDLFTEKAYRMAQRARFEHGELGGER